MPKDVRFWRNVVMIGMAHIAVIVGLMRWSSQAKPAPAQTIVWMDGGAAEERFGSIGTSSNDSETRVTQNRRASSRS